MRDLWLLLRDPRVSVTLALSAAVIVGFALVAASYQGVAPLLFVPKQVPFVVSGGVAGLGLIGTALMALRVHLDRIEAAQERRELADIQRRALLLLKALKERS
jgi:hypothetical protein